MSLDLAPVKLAVGSIGDLNVIGLVSRIIFIHLSVYYCGRLRQRMKGDEVVSSVAAAGDVVRVRGQWTSP